MALKLRRACTINNLLRIGRRPPCSGINNSSCAPPSGVGLSATICLGVHFIREAASRRLLLFLFCMYPMMDLCVTDNESCESGGEDGGRAVLDGGGHRYREDCPVQWIWTRRCWECPSERQGQRGGHGESQKGKIKNVIRSIKLPLCPPRSMV